MHLTNGINDLHHAYAHAVYQGFPEYEYEDRDWEHYRKTREDRRVKKSGKHTEYNISLHSMFPQTWGSTALGFGGIGGQAITPAYTIILESEQGAGFCVYFGGRFAYRIERPNKVFMEDIVRRSMSEVSGAKQRYEEAKDAA